MLDMANGVPPVLLIVRLCAVLDVPAVWPPKISELALNSIRGPSPDRAVAERLTASTAPEPLRELVVKFLTLKKKDKIYFASLIQR